MQAYIIRRLLALIPTLIFASVIVFFSIRLIPGDVIDLMLSQNDISTGQDRANIEAALGLDRPVIVQYFRWVGSAMMGDFGNSLWQNTPVSEQLLARMPISFELGLLALIVALSVALPIGVYSAMRQDSLGDYITRLILTSDACDPQLLARHPGDGLSLGLVALVTGARVHPIPGGSDQESEPHDRACHSSRPVDVRGNHADDPNDDARGDAPGLHSHRASQGSRRNTSRRAPRSFATA